MRYSILSLPFLLLLGACGFTPPAQPVHTPPLETAKIRQNTTYAHYPDPNMPVYDHGYDRLNTSGPVGMIGGSGSGIYIGIGGGITKREVRSGQDYRGPEQLDYGGRLNH